MSRLTRDRTAEAVSGRQILRHQRGQGNIPFFCSADHEQDWQPYSVDPYSCYMCDDTTLSPCLWSLRIFLYSDRRPRNWWSFILCISNRNNTQEPDSETRDRRTRAESDKQEQKNKSDSEGTIRERNNPRKNNFSTNPGNFSEHYIFLTQNRGYVLNTRTPSLI